MTASEESLSVAVAKSEQAASDGSVNFTLKLVATCWVDCSRASCWDSLWRRWESRCTNEEAAANGRP